MIYLDELEKVAVDRTTLKHIGHLLAAAAAGASALHAAQMLTRKHGHEKKASAWSYAKPVLIGAGLGAGAGALTAPTGQKRSWAISGGVVGGLSSGPLQVLAKRVAGKGGFKELAKAEIPHQSTAELAKWTGIGAAASAGLTAAMGGYSGKSKGTRAGQFADAGIDLGELLVRSIRG